MHLDAVLVSKSHIPNIPKCIGYEPEIGCGVRRAEALRWSGQLREHLRDQFARRVLAPDITQHDLTEVRTHHLKNVAHFLVSRCVWTKLLWPELPNFDVP